MNRFKLIIISFFLISGFCVVNPTAYAGGGENSASTPFFFTANRGQFPGAVLFQARISGATVYLCQDEIVTVFSRRVEKESGRQRKECRNPFVNVKMDSEPEKIEVMSIVAKLMGAKKDAAVRGDGPLPNCNNYFIGKDPDRWYRDVPNYSGIVYENIYAGIDLKYFGDEGLLEYDFILRPGADPCQIQIRYEGIRSLRINARGDLQVETDWGIITEQRPVIYQLKNGKRIPVRGEYDLITPDSFGFRVKDAYDTGACLIIDPVLTYSTYLGGNDRDTGNGIAINAGCAYISGNTESTDFPLANPYQGTHGGGGGTYYYDVFVTKLNAQGTGLVYSTYLGGGGDDYGHAIAVDTSGNAFITGSTTSSDFPIENPYQDTNDGLDVFLTKLNAYGNNLVYGTYLGGDGNDKGWGVAVNASGHAFITGETRSTDFPVENPYQDHLIGSMDIFVTQFNPEGTGLVYSTYFGGNDWEWGYDIGIDSSDNAYITGGTGSNDFPTQNPFQGSIDGWDDVFVTKLSADGQDLIYSTYLGSSLADTGIGIAVDADGHAYIAGMTGLDPLKNGEGVQSKNNDDFPTQNPFQGASGGGEDAFVTKMNTQGNGLVYSTYLGGSGDEWGFDIALDSEGNAYTTGWTTSDDFPLENPLQESRVRREEVFITQLNAPGNALVYSTYHGGYEDERGWGIAVNAMGQAYITGHTYSDDFPTQNPFQNQLAGSLDAFVMKISLARLKVETWLEEKSDFENQPRIKGEEERTFQNKE